MSLRLVRLHPPCDLSMAGPSASGSPVDLSTDHRRPLARGRREKVLPFLVTPNLGTGEESPDRGTSVNCES